MDPLRELHRDGATIVIVTHDPRYPKRAERTLHLFHGQIVLREATQTDATEELEQSRFEVRQDPQPET